MKIKRITIAAFILALAVQSFDVNAKTVTNRYEETEQVASTLIGYNYYGVMDKVIYILQDLSGADYFPEVAFDGPRMIDIFEDLNLDSLDAFEFLIRTEKEFAISIDDEKFCQLMREPLVYYCQYIYSQLN